MLFSKPERLETFPCNFGDHVLHIPGYWENAQGLTSVTVNIGHLNNFN